MITSKWCLSCSDKIYDPNGSSTKKDGTYGIKDLAYKDIKYTGTTIKDRACIRNAEKCLDDFEFFIVTSTSDPRS